MESKPYCYKYPHPAVTTDCVIFGYDGRKLKVLLIERGIEPYKGRWAFPGGFLNMDETAEEGALRELQEETGLTGPYIKQFHTFTDPARDPRERVITIAFYALVRLQDVRGGDDAARAQWFALDEIPPLAFDHEELLQKAQIALRRHIHFEPIGFELLPERFTMSQLQNLYEAILDVQFDRRNFSKKMLRIGLILEVENEAETRTETTQTRRSPMYYRFNAEKYAVMKQKGFRLEF